MGWPRRKVGVRVLAGALVIGALSAVTGALAVLTLQGVGRLFTEMTADTALELIDAAELAQRTGLLAADLSALFVADDEATRGAVRARIAQRLAALDGDLARWGRGRDASQMDRGQMDRGQFDRGEIDRREIARARENFAAALEVLDHHIVGRLAAAAKTRRLAAGGLDLLAGVEAVERLETGATAWASAVKEVVADSLAASLTQDEATLDRLDAARRQALERVAARLARLEPAQAPWGATIRARMEELSREATALGLGDGPGDRGLLVARPAEASRQAATAEAWEDARLAAERLGVAVAGGARAKAEDRTRQVETAGRMIGLSELAIFALAGVALFGAGVLVRGPHRDLAPPETGPERGSVADSAGESVLSGLTLVVVEGDAVERAVLVRGLQDADAIVADAVSLEEAVELVDLAAPDALIIGGGLGEDAPIALLAALLAALTAAGSAAPPCLLLLDPGQTAPPMLAWPGGRLETLPRPPRRLAVLERVLALVATDAQAHAQAHAQAGAKEGGDRAGAGDPPVPQPAAGPALDFEGSDALDLDHVREIFGGLDAGVVEMLGYFIETTQPLLATIDAGLAEGDLARVREAAHAASGAARTAGAKALAEVCSALERAAVAGDHAAARALGPPLAAAFAPVVAAIIGLANALGVSLNLSPLEARDDVRHTPLMSRVERGEAEG